MSATPPTQANNNTGASTPSSAWSRGPPLAATSKPSSAIQSPNPSGTPQPQAEANGNNVPVAIGTHSRKGSMLVGNGVDIKRGSLAFGTVDSPNPLLSSSPAAPSITGTHLSDTVKSFGTIEADTSTDPNARRSAGAKTLDAHALFGAKPKSNGAAHDRRQSIGSFQGPNGINHLRPPQGGPGQPRSPVLGQPPFNPQFRPAMPGPQGFVRPNPQMNMPRNMGNYGMPQGPYPGMGYPNQYFEYSNYPPQYGVPQWAPQQHPQNQQFSPRANPAQLNAPSPAPLMAPLPSVSPTPTPPSRPPSLHQSNAPSTPSRPLMPTTTSFTPPVQGQYGLSGSAASFTPRKPVKFTRPDGTPLDIKSAAAATKVPTTPVISGAVTPEAKEDPPKKKVPTMPVIVRMETESQRMARLEEEAQAARIKEVEAKEEEERKERKARQAREQEEKLKEAEEARKAEEAKAQEMEEAEARENAVKEVKAKETEAKEAAAKEAAELVAKEAASKEAADAAAAAATVTEAAAKENLPTPAASTPTSPLPSPALPATGLPPKPLGANLPRRPAPAEIQVSNPATPTTSAVSTARRIEDLKSITYPGTTKSPRPELNADAEPGKFRYDREFLMQFMSVCKEKPDSLPSLEEIGLEADSSSGFGTSRSGRGSSRASMGSRQPTGLGIGGVNARPGNFAGQGMGTFGMGQFSSSGSLRGSTSEERYNRSLGQSRGGMARTPSQGGMHGLPTMSLSTSRSGTNRSRGGVKRAPQTSQLDPDVAPLAISTNSWVKSRPTGDDEGSPAFIERKVKALLNKLTAEKFDSISVQILEWANKSANETDGMTLKLVIKQIFEKATDEAHWSSMYARLCRMLLERLDPAITETFDDKPVSGGLLFRKYLVGRCQVDFEAGWKAREDAATAAAAKSEEDRERLAQQEKEEGNGEAAMLSDEYYAAQKAKRRGLGLVQLIGELYKLDMIGKGVIRTCFVRLLSNVENPDEEDIESSCKLLTTVGAQFDHVSPENMEIVFERLNVVLNSENVSSRIRFMIMDVIDLRREKWASKKNQGSVMTIAEIHQQAAREQAEKSAAAAQSNRESISRGGSRAGGRRDAQPGEWQSVAPAARIASRADFTNLGRGVSSSGSAGPNFGPKSVFAQGKGKIGGTTTPPALSRQTSTTNMFSALDAMEQPASEDRRGSADEPQRRKLNLAPRTKPIAGEEGEESGDEEELSTPLDVSVEMSADKAKTKIESDMKELWGEKDAGGSRNPDDVVEYFRALPKQHQSLLAERLTADVFRISKLKDAEVVAKAWTQALDGAVTKEVLMKGLSARMPTLDDDSIDFPQAYKAIALLIRSISLSKEEVEGLVKQIDVYGEPKITPQMKLDRALQAVDEE